MTILFLSRGLRPGEPRPPLPEDLTLRVWRPRADGLPTLSRHFSTNIAWWAFDRFGLFTNAEFHEFTIWRGEQQLHRLIVTPRWRRFPFMAPDDLQIGALWTAPLARRQGIARLAILHALGAMEARPGHDARRIWFAVDSVNEPSVRLGHRCGFTLAGHGRRTAPLGLAVLGTFCLDHLA